MRPRLHEHHHTPAPVYTVDSSSRSAGCGEDRCTYRAQSVDSLVLYRYDMMKKLCVQCVLSFRFHCDCVLRTQRSRKAQCCSTGPHVLTIRPQGIGIYRARMTTGADAKRASSFADCSRSIFEQHCSSRHLACYLDCSGYDANAYEPSISNDSSAATAGVGSKGRFRMKVIPQSGTEICTESIVRSWVLVTFLPLL